MEIGNFTKRLKYIDMITFMRKSFTLVDYWVRPRWKTDLQFDNNYFKTIL